MRIIISPAKKMNINTDLISAQGMPFQMDKTEQLMNWMKSKSLEEAKSIWKCNDSLARVNYDRFQQMDLYKNLSPAILSYEGIQYQYMAPAVFEDKSFQYIQEHLRILSGFYGVQKGTFAKMARGEMVRFLAERQSKNIEDAKEFNHLGYRFDESLSSENEYLFIKEN